MTFSKLSMALALCAAPMAALAGCPQPPDHRAALADLTQQVHDAASQDAARAITDRMWELWTDAPDEAAQEMLDRGMSRRSGYDLLGALEDFDRLVHYCPNYAEGYNQRAFVNYLRQDFATALVDLDRALALSPRHVAALSGKALTLMGLNRFDEARLVLAEALALNPWLPERNLAVRGGPLEPLGQDI